MGGMGGGYEDEDEEDPFGDRPRRGGGMMRRSSPGGMGGFPGGAMRPGMGYGRGMYAQPNIQQVTMFRVDVQFNGKKIELEEPTSLTQQRGTPGMGGYGGTTGIRRRTREEREM
jgi:hypothetical protein